MKCPICKTGNCSKTNKPTRGDQWSLWLAQLNMRNKDLATALAIAGFQVLSYGAKRLLFDTYECPNCHRIWRKWF